MNVIKCTRTMVLPLNAGVYLNTPALSRDVWLECVNILVFMILIIWKIGIGLVDLTMMHFENDEKKQIKADSVLWLKETEK